MFVSATMWVIMGWDSTLHYTIFKITGQTGELGQSFGEGLHWTSLLNAFTIAFFVSVYLSRKKIEGFHNLAIGLFIPFVAFMLFEVIWVFFYDLFHNNPLGTPWALTLYGTREPINTFFIFWSYFFAPFCLSYAVFLLCRKVLLPSVTVLLFFIGSWLLGFFGVTLMINTIGTPTVLLRNWTGLVGFGVFLHATLQHAIKYNTKVLYSVKARRGSIFWFLLLGSIITFSVWVIAPFPFEIVKGTRFPQTVYAWYDSETGIISDSLWVPNVIIHSLQIVSKAFITSLAVWVLIPSIKVLPLQTRKAGGRCLV